ncbi:hypothetical protein F2P81_002523 [Scophthalmus maximus]|uniref:Uncharacterized protein n=1 Tax=Scophthalmus maximus TaxID=52904 RepID=A0A6A4TRY8_SCOMX|nr:hypothetical protein F2P81_002523 [Scophthalmus maximus]
MVFRKLPGVSASGMGLRLSQKFVFLLFLSGLVTLCFGALFFLPDSVRLKRIFLSKTETQPVTVGSGSENDAREAHPKRAKEQERPRAVASAKGETSTKLKSLSRPPAGSHEATAARAPEDRTLPRSRTESASQRATSAARGAAAAPDTFSYRRFKGCLLKPPLGSDSGKPGDPATTERREKVKEAQVKCSRNRVHLLSNYGSSAGGVAYLLVKALRTFYNTSSRVTGCALEKVEWRGKGHAVNLFLPHESRRVTGDTLEKS